MSDIDERLDEKLWRTHARELVRYATLLVGPADAEDVVSTAFLRVMGSRARTHPRVRAYLFRAVTTTAIDRQRSDARRARRDRLAASPDTIAGPESHRDLHAAIAGLGTRQRAIVYFTYWEDLDPTAIARTLHISPSTVNRDLAHARRILKGALS